MPSSSEVKLHLFFYLDICKFYIINSSVSVNITSTCDTNNILILLLNSLIFYSCYININILILILLLLTGLQCRCEYQYQYDYKYAMGLG